MDRKPQQAAPTPQQDVPRVDDEHRLEPPIRWGNGAPPPVVIHQTHKRPQRSASERAYDGPGLSDAIELLEMPSPNHLALADTMLAHPSERDAILAEIDKHGDPRLRELVLKAESEKREAQNKTVKIGKEGPQVGDTKTYPAPAFSTDKQHDSFVDREAAREQRDRARAAERAGDKPHDPIGDRLNPKKDAPTQGERNASRKADDAIDAARDQLRDAGVPEGR